MIRRQIGVVKVLLILVKDVIYPTDFVVLETGEDEEMPLVLGKIFLALANVLVDVEKARITIRVHDEGTTNIKKCARWFNNVEHVKNEVVSSLTQSS